MNDRELLELIAAQVGKLTGDVGKLTGDVGKLTGDVGKLTGDVGKLTGDVSKLTGDVSKLTGDVGEIKDRQVKLENIVTRIEHDHGKKLEALFDGYKQNNDRLDRIEKAVTNQEEYILKRVK